MVKKQIIVLDDEPLVSILMKEIIEDGEDLQVAQIVSGKTEFLNRVGQDSFDAAIIDISIGGYRDGGIELLEMMKNKAMSLPTIMLSAHDEQYYALKCLQAGARGYINKKYICTDVTICLKKIFAGHLFVSGEKGAQIVNQFIKLNASTSVQSV